MLAGCLLLTVSMVRAQIQPQHIPDTFKNVWVKKLHSDSNCTVFLIAIKKGVRLHKHVRHTENVTVLSGKAILSLGDSTFKIKKGQVITIPMGTPHKVKVKGRKPLVIYSVQSPRFTGKDRVWLKE